MASDDLDFEDRGALRAGGPYALGPVEAYVDEWNTIHAFREFWQNWVDAMIDTNKIGRKDLEISHYQDSKGAFIAEARHRNTEILYGYMRFASGMLELTNFNARLTRNSLDIGQSSKKGNAKMAGCHGEGFKLASLVMEREGFHVRYESGGFNWNMKLGGGKKDKCQNMLHCTITALSPARLEREKDEYAMRAGMPRETKSYTLHDVTVKIGKFERLGTKIEPGLFEQWKEATIDLNPPKKGTKVHTAHGSLILDPAFKGKLYLKNLLINGAATSKAFQHGYNFFKGKVNRDRERLSNPAHEASTLACIWASAMETKPEIVKDYVNMLREDEVADVHDAGRYITEKTAERIWKHLLELDPERQAFYYDTNSGDRDVDIIRHSLKKQPQQLPRCIWKPLRRFSLIRTPQEHQSHLLHNAPLSERKDTLYATGFRRALMAVLSLNDGTRELEVTFKSEATTNLDLIIIGTSLEINDKWLNFHNSHQESPCMLSRRTEQTEVSVDNFTCVHMVMELYEIVESELMRHSRPNCSESLESRRSRSQRIYESLCQMPLMVTVKEGQYSGEIDVTWADSEGDILSRCYGFEPDCHVTLHQESTCARKKNILLFITSDSEPVMSFENNSIDSLQNVAVAKCQCPEMTLPQKYFKATFKHLNLAEKYFPMISRSESKSIIGLAPEGIQPMSSDILRGSPDTVSNCDKSSSRKFQSIKNSVDDFEQVPETSNGVESGFESSSDNEDSRAKQTVADHFATDLSGSLRSQSTSELANETLSATNNSSGNSASEASPYLIGPVDAPRSLIQLASSSRSHSRVAASIGQGVWTSIPELEEQKDNADTNYIPQLDETREQLRQVKSELAEAQARVAKLEEDLETANNLLVIKQKEADDLKAITSSSVSEPHPKSGEANEVHEKQVRRLRNRIEELEDKKKGLESELDAAEHTLDEQIRLFLDTTARRRKSSRSLKRERNDESDDMAEQDDRPSRRQRTSSTEN